MTSAGARGIAVVTGGLAADVGLMESLREAAAEQRVHIDIRAHEKSVLAGALGAKITGRRRDEYFKVKLQFKQALSDTGVMISLAAEVEGAFVRCLLARVYYGEFGNLKRSWARWACIPNSGGEGLARPSSISSGQISPASGSPSSEPRCPGTTRLLSHSGTMNRRNKPARRPCALCRKWNRPHPNTGFAKRRSAGRSLYASWPRAPRAAVNRLVVSGPDDQCSSLAMTHPGRTILARARSQS